jgi:electron transfer flavoprotein alpha subunit
MDHKGVWILAEQSAGRIQRISHELLTRGRALAEKRRTDLTAVVLGHGLRPDDLEELIERGADRVLAMEAAQLEFFLPEPHAACLSRLLEEYRPEILIAGATTAGRTVMPYVAVKANTGLTADCTLLDIEEETGNLLQTRPAIGGNIMATIKTPSRRPQMATVRPRSTKPAPRQSGRRGEIVRLQAPPELMSSRVKRIGFQANPEEHGLAEAEVVVVVGRGIKKGENVRLVQKIVERLRAALGATRDVVDRGWLSYPHQIGLSGKTVTPKLYLGVGVSGSIQHLAGMQTSEAIVAVNIDPDSQIFRVADFGIVGDLFEIVPVLTERLAKLKGVAGK